MNDEIWVLAPPGFRPSQWVEMLMDFDEAYDLDPYLVDRRCGEHGEVLVLSLDLLNPNEPQHQALLWEMLDKVARMGLILRPPTGLELRYPEVWGRVLAFCGERQVRVEQPL